MVVLEVLAVDDVELLVEVEVTVDVVVLKVV